MAATFAGKLARKTPEHETEPAESTHSPETGSAAPHYLQPGFSAGDPPPSPLVRSQIALQTKLTINQPGDVYEQEADRVASQVMSAPGFASGPQQVMRKTTEEEKEEEQQAREGHVQTKRSPQQVMRKTTEEEKEEEQQAREGHVQTKRANGSGAPTEAPAAVNQTISSSGQPLEPDTRAYMEERFGQDFSGVQIHTDSQAAQSASEIGAEAYTVGSHIAFNEGRYAPGTSHGDMLIAHELTHYVQQGGQTAAVQSPEGGVAVQQYASDEFVQRLAIPDWVLDQLPDPVANLAREIEAAGGIFAYIENLMSGIVERVFGGLERGVNTVAELIEAFTTLYTTIPIISISIASGNREMFMEAVNNLADALQTIVGHAWDALDTLLGPVRDFLNGVVATLDQPIEQWIESVGGSIWTTIINIGRNVWNWTADIRESTLGGPIWSEIRDFLDITGPDTYDGLVNWIEEQASAVWAGIMNRLSGVITGIQETAATINDVISVENIKTLREVVDGWIITARDFILALNSDDGNGITSQQELLRTVLIPMLQSGAAALRDLVIGAGTWVAGIIAILAEKVTGFIATIAANSLLGAVIPELFAWVSEAINSLSEWAQNIVVGLFNTIGDTIAYLSEYIEPFLTTLINLVTATTDLVGSLPNLLTAAWEAIPAWIRDPIKNFILDQVLARIPIFGELVRNPDVWARVQATAMQILQQIFVSGDLVGAAWTFFQALLELLNFPTELVVQIISKAAAVFTQIFEDPVGFLLNLLGAVKQGFTQFFGNILNHLLGGVTDWLLGQASEAGVQPPTDLSLGSILQFVLDILGLSMDLIWERLALKIGEERVAQIKTAINVLTGAWEWISVAINDGPGALWEMMQSQISQLWSTIIGAAMEWITMKIIERVTLWLLSLLDPTGIMAVVNSLIALYKAIESFIQYIRQMLEIINTVLDGIGQIAAGVIGAAANYLENALASSLPIAIGFLANQLGLGNIGKKLGEIIQTVREYVTKGIDWLIDKALAIGQGALNMLGLGGDTSAAPAADTPETPEEEDAAGIVATAPFAMSGTDHTLTARVNEQGKVEIFMASSIAERLAIGLADAIDRLERQYDPDFHDPWAEKTLTDLKGLQQDLGDFLEFYPLEDRPQKQREMQDELTVIARKLRIMADSRIHPIHELQDIFYDPSLPDERWLPNGYDVREKLYERGSGYSTLRKTLIDATLKKIKTDVIAAQAQASSTTFDNLKAGGKLIPENSDKATFKPHLRIPTRWQDVPEYKDETANGYISYVADHDPPLAGHWEATGGNNIAGDQARWDAAAGRGGTTLEVVTAKYNLSKGSKLPGSDEERALFTNKYYVGPNFTSKYAENNSPSAKKIDDKPFLQTRGGTPIP